MFEQEMAQRNLILKVLTGSFLYGTNTESSDKDYVGVCIPNRDYVLGIKRFDQAEIKTNPSDSGHRNVSTDTDMVIYSLPKFIHLLAENNPNIIEILFAPKKNILFCNEFGERLLQAVSLFVSKKTKHTFCGYAYSQKQKILTKQPIGRRVEYMEKFGWDVKFGSHLIRLLTEGLELLVEGKIALPLTNNNYIRDIKIGKFSKEHVLAEATRYETLVEEAYIRSTLPNTPNFEEINKLQIGMLEDFWMRG